MATDDDDIPDSGAVFTFGKSRFADNTANKFWIRNDKVIQVSCGDDHTSFVTASGRLYTFGANEWGQLGLGHTKSANKPSSVKALKQHGVVLVGCGRLHTIACTKAGQLYAFGAGGEGQLGGGDTQGAESPAPISSLDDTQYKDISCGTDHTAVLTDDGRLYMFGGGSDGQLGLGSTTETELPRELSLGISIKHVSCGYYHTALVTDNGKLYTFGENEMGKLGLGDDRGDISTNTPQHVDSIQEPVMCVSCGNSHTAAITESGSVYTFGDGSHGQLGQGPSLLQLSKPQKVSRLSSRKCRTVSCGESHTAVITDKGSLYTFGDGRHGKLGQGEESFSNLFTPTRVTRFRGFSVEQVSCGGCHMIVRARRRDASNGEISEESDSEETDPLKMSSGLQTRLQSSIADIDNRLDNSLDLNASLGGTARNRRRQKESTPLPPLARTLPPLGGSTPRSNLPGLSQTTKPLNNPLNQGLIPNIKHEQEAIRRVQVSRTNGHEEESEEESEESEEEEEEGEDETDSSRTDPFATRYIATSGKWADLQPLRNRPHKLQPMKTHFSKSGTRQGMEPLVTAMHKAKRKEKKKSKANGTILKEGGDAGSHPKANGKPPNKDDDSEEEEDEDDDDDDDEDSDDESEDEDDIQKTRQEMKQKAQLEKQKAADKTDGAPPSKANRPVPAVRTSKTVKQKEEEKKVEEDSEEEDEDDEDDDDDDDDEDESDEENDQKAIPSKGTKSNKKPDKPAKSSKKEEDEDDDDDDDDEDEEEDDDEDEDEDEKKKPDEKTKEKSKPEKKEEKAADKKDNSNNKEEEPEIKSWQFWKKRKQVEPDQGSKASTSSGDQSQSKACTIL